MNEWDSFSYSILFHLFPALLGYFFIKHIKFRFSVIILLSIILMVIGYFSYLTISYMAPFLLLGSGLAYYENKIRKPKLRGKK